MPTTVDVPSRALMFPRSQPPARPRCGRTRSRVWERCLTGRGARPHGRAPLRDQLSDSVIRPNVVTPTSIETVPQPPCSLCTCSCAASCERCELSTVVVSADFLAPALMAVKFGGDLQGVTARGGGCGSRGRHSMSWPRPATPAFRSPPGGPGPGSGRRHRPQQHERRLSRDDDGPAPAGGRAVTVTSCLLTRTNAAGSSTAQAEVVGSAPRHIRVAMRQVRLTAKITRRLAPNAPRTRLSPVHSGVGPGAQHRGGRPHGDRYPPDVGVVAERRDPHVVHARCTARARRTSHEGCAA